MMNELRRNVASQTIRVFAFDRTDSSPVTGDAANITAQITLDDGTPAASNDTNPTEVDATDEPGYYKFTLTQAESNADFLDFVAKSATANVQVITEGGSRFRTYVDNFYDAVPPAAGAIADAVWDEDIDAAHQTANTAGKRLDDASSTIATNLNDDVAGIQTDVTAILADTNELQTDWVNGGRLDLILDARASQASVDALNDFDPATQTVNLSIATEAQIDAIEADTNELQTDWVNGGRLDLILDARASQASVDALNDFNPATETVNLSTVTEQQIDDIESNLVTLLLGFGTFGTVNDATATQSSFTVSADFSDVDDRYNGLRVYILSGTQRGRRATITDQVGRSLTLGGGLTGAPEDGAVIAIMS